MHYEHLFSPIKINGLELKNRIIMPSMVTSHAAVNGEVSDKLINYHAARARGGCALNMVEATYVHRSGNSYHRGVGISDDLLIPGLARLTSAVHTEGGKIGIQLQHGGRTAIPASSGGPILLVSHLPGITPYEESRIMNADDIGVIREAYVQAAGRAVEAGFDLIELHGAHGYLLNQFVSPHTNRRDDEYGGTFEKRMRFPLEVLKAVRSKVGPDYPIMYRMSVEEFISGGIDLNMACDIARLLVDNGVDALNISVGIAETNEYTIPPSAVPEGWNADRAEAIKKAVSARVPVSVAGRIINGRIAEHILSSGKADIVAMGRALIADPLLPQKTLAGMERDVRPCVACNEGCVGAFGRIEPVSCAVNPLAGYEGMFPAERAATPRRVLIVGGGPAGMQAALTAARRGHDVTLAEKEQHLGGLLNVAKLPPHKQAYGDLVAYWEQALSRMGVNLLTGVKADASFIMDFNADTVFVATGSTPLRPGFCRESRAVAAEDILRGAPCGKQILMLGGGLVACETAEFLAEQGKKVTIVELRDEIALDVDLRTRRLLLPRLDRLGVTAFVRHEILELLPDGARVRDVWRAEVELTGFDTLVLGLGYAPNNTLAQELAREGVPATAIGDCLRPGKVMEAVHQAMRAAYAL